MICGVVLLDREDQFVIWTLSSGIYQVSQNLQVDLQKERLGQSIDFETNDSGIAISYSIHDSKVGGYVVTKLKGGRVQLLGKIAIPNESQQELAGWIEPAVYCSYTGMVPTTTSILSSLRKLPPDITYEEWLDWDPRIENFCLNDSNPRPAQKQFFEKNFLPWRLENTEETGLMTGVVSARTNFTTFVATEHGDFVLFAGTERIGSRPPTLGSYLIYKARAYNERAQNERTGIILEYEVLPMPNAVQVHALLSNNMQCSFRCLAQLVRFDEGYSCLHNETLHNIYDYEKLLGTAELGTIYDIAVRRHKNGLGDIFDNGWKVMAFFGIIKERIPDWQGPRATRNSRDPRSIQSNLPDERELDCDSEVGSSISASNQDRSHLFNPRSVQRKSTPTPDPTNELRGIVVNQVHGRYFIYFEDGLEAALKTNDAYRENLFLKTGDHVLCKVKKVESESSQSNKTHGGYIVHSCRIIQPPKGFEAKGLTKSGLIIMSCPLTYLRLSDRAGRDRKTLYPLFTNQLMPIVHDFDRKSLKLGEALDEKYLRELRVVAIVTRTRIPGYQGVNGWILEEILDLERVEQVSDKHESPIEDIENTFTRSLVQGFVIKKWGLFLIIWLIDGRLAVLDVRNFPKGSQPPLGSFIECDDIRETEAPYLGDDVAYYWEIFSQRPYQVNDCQGIMNEGKMSIVHCKSLIFESFRLVNKVRQAHFSHRFFGQIEDRDGVFAMSPCPGDLIEAYIRPVIIGESEIQWVIDDRRPKQKMTPRAVVAPMSRLKLSKDQNETSQSKPIPNQTESSSNHGDSPSSSQASTSKESKKVEKTREEILEMIKANKDLSQIAAEVDPDLFAEVLSSTF